MPNLLSYFPTVSAKLAHEIETKTKGETATTVGAQTTIQIVAPQPVKPRELVITEPGERLSDYRSTWTQTAIIPTDEIEYLGIKYRVHSVGFREGEFYRVIMREKIANVA